MSEQESEGSLGPGHIPPAQEQAVPVEPKEQSVEDALQDLATNVAAEQVAIKEHLAGTRQQALSEDPQNLENILANMDSDLDGDDEERQEEEITVVKPENLLNERVTLKEPMFKALPAGADPQDFLTLPSLTEEEVADLRNQLGSLKFATESTQMWAEVVSESMNYLNRGNQLAMSLLRPGSDWRQYPEYEGQKLTIGAPSSKNQRKSGAVKGDEALVINARIMGNYGNIQIPLFASGVWLNVRTPSNDELHILEQQLASATYQLGYMTNGLVYSNTSVISNMLVVQFILDRVLGSNLVDSSVKSLEQSILLTDMYALVASYAAAVFPQGFPYGRACSNGPIKCDHIEKEVLRLSKMILTDVAALKPEQLKHMASRTVGQKYKPEDLARYRNHFTHYGDRRVELKENELAVVLSPPTLAQYRESGDTWVSNIVGGANKLLTDSSTREIDDFIRQQYLLSTMRQYGHWVKRVEYPLWDGEEELPPTTVEDSESIEAVLSDLSNQSDVANAFIGAISKYIDECSLTVVGVKRGQCSKCGGLHGHDSSHPYIIPIDPVHTFFILRGLKIRSTLLAYTAH